MYIWRYVASKVQLDKAHNKACVVLNSVTTGGRYSYHDYSPGNG